MCTRKMFSLSLNVTHQPDQNDDQRVFRVIFVELAFFYLRPPDFFIFASSLMNSIVEFF